MGNQSFMSVKEAETLGRDVGHWLYANENIELATGGLVNKIKDFIKGSHVKASTIDRLEMIYTEDGGKIQSWFFENNSAAIIAVHDGEDSGDLYLVTERNGRYESNLIARFFTVDYLYYDGGWFYACDEALGDACILAEYIANIE